MKREWKPGDVAMVRLDPETEIRVMFNGANWFGRKGAFYDLHASARPLVVIDPEDREQVERLVEAWLSGFYDIDNESTHLRKADAMQAALRSLIEPPKPEEPTGLGAVVEVVGGARWLHAYVDAGRKQWIDHDGRIADYEELAAVRVLSEGVTQ